MRLRVIDDSVDFACGSCTACCNQPWRTLIEEDKVQAIDSHDFSAYPQLAGVEFYQQSKQVPPGYAELAKGEGHKCLFLDTDGLCIIHKELGMQAKPHMCQQFPFISSPTPAKMLFTATLYPDTVPNDSMQSMGVGQRLLLIPRLMSLATQNGVYASRLLECNISIRDVMRHQVEGRLDDESTELLLRYFRSRFWQRTALSKELSFVAGLHQHILDLGTILFFARVSAHRTGSTRLTDKMIRDALKVVEFHLANQYRLYHMTLKGWLTGQLNNPKSPWPACA